MDGDSTSWTDSSASLIAVPNLRRRLFLTAFLALLAACSEDAPRDDVGQSNVPAAPPPASEALFVDRAADVGLDFVHWNGMSGELYLAEITCSGAALVDVDQDGDLDVYLVQGRTLASPAPVDPEPQIDRLYLNRLVEEGRLRFDDATATMGVRQDRYGCAIAAGDADGDGLPDLYVLNLDGNQLLRNLGGGRFADVTAAAGLSVGGDGDGGDGGGPGTTATFFDMDGDGDLDLFAGTYSDFRPENEPDCQNLAGDRDYCGPGSFPMVADRLYRNTIDENGALVFEDVTAASGLGAAPKRPALGVVAGDWNGDGAADLYVANDGEVNHLWLNDGTGVFTDEALLAGAALNRNGAAEASMGVDAADIDDDGDLDLLLAHLIKETNTLYLNDGRAIFTDASAATGLGPPSLPFTSFGIGFLDVQNDGRLDVFVANGAVVMVPELVAQGDPFPLHQTNQLFLATGARFEDATARSGAVFELSEVSRGAAFGDVDNDGDVDVLVTNIAGPARLLVNQVGQDGAWLGVRLVTGEPPRDALGARAALLVDGRATTWRRVRADGSYASASDPRIVFGKAAGAQGVRVVWDDGTVEDFMDIEAGRYNVLQR